MVEIVANISVQETPIIRKVLDVAFAYRWLTLSIAVLVLSTEGKTSPAHWRLLAFSVVYTASLTFWRRPLMSAVQRQPEFILIDMAIMLAQLGFAGGWGTPFFLYSLSPIVLSGLALGFWCSTITAVVFSLGYALMIYSTDAWLIIARSQQTPTYLQHHVIFLLMAVVFGYPGSTIERLTALERSTAESVGTSMQLSADLKNTCDRLMAVHRLSPSFQKALDHLAIIELAAKSACTKLNFDRCAIYLQPLLPAKSGHWAVYEKSSDKLVKISKSPDFNAAATFPRNHLLKNLGFKRLDQVCITKINTVRERYLGTIVVEFSSGHRIGNETCVKALAALIASSLARAGAMTEKSRAEERITTAVKLHESVVQSLAAGILQLLLAREELACGESGGAYLLKTNECFQKTLEGLRELSDPRPIRASGRALTETLNDRCRALRDKGLQVKLKIDKGSDNLAPKTNDALTAIACEALTNIIKHSGATTIIVYLGISNDSVHFEISDNGIGFDSSKPSATDRPHFGLELMRQLTSEADGELCIQSAQNGTKIDVTLPLNQEITNG